MLPESSSSKRRVVSVDRISPLPDSILRVILSFLAMEEAVATSVLSKRWKFVWVSVPCLDFHFYPKFTGVAVDPTKFIDFVNHVLDLNTCRLLNKFNFVWSTYLHLISSSIIDTWINIAITKNVRDLSLRCVRPGGPKYEYEYDVNFLRLSYSYVIPINVFCCESLHSLALIECIVSIDDPNLESLRMSPVSFKSEQACEMILSGCPSLKFLHLNISDGDFECTISSDTLIRLKLCFEGECIFNLRKAPALEYLMLQGPISEISIDTSLVSLVEAHFDAMLDRYPFSSNSIVQVVRAFHSVKVLTLSFDVIQALAKATINLSTEFKRLVKLVAGTCSSIQDFIYYSENLQVLVIQKDDEDRHESNFKYHSRLNCPGSGEVPRCLSNTLKEVRIVNYVGLEDENEMIRFMLQHGRVLELMEISCTKADEEYYEEFHGGPETGRGMFESDLLSKISMCPKISPACQVLFSYAYL